MKVLAITHDQDCGPGSLENFFRARDDKLAYCRLEQGQKLPGSFSGFDALVILGGPMSVNGAEQYSFLEPELGAVREAVLSGLPVLGICLGAQIIAAAGKAAVYQARVAERGFCEVMVKEAGRTDRLFHGLPIRFPVFQWHEETFNLPVGSTLLASSFSGPRQAFRYRNAYGLQFHPEVTRELIAGWVDAPALRKSLLARFDELESALDRISGRLYLNFLDLAQQKAAKAKPQTRTS